MSHYRPKDGKDGLPGTHGKDGRDGIDGQTPEHDWVGTNLRFKAPNGEFGEFVDLEGPKGEKGDEGPQGEEGPQGPKGDQGPRGLKGEKGDKGDRGSDGEKGDIGPMPDHQWRDTSLRFQDPDGTWGRYVNLKGEKGDPGIPGSSGGGLSRITASKVEVATLPGATYNNVQEVINVMFSPGIISGGEVTELSPTVVRITGGTAVARVQDDNTSELRFFDFSSQDFSVPDVQVTHFYALDYNGGSPIMVESTVTENWDRDTEIPLGSAVRGDGFLNVTPNPYRTGDVITNLIQRLDAVSPVQRDNSVGGLILGQAGTRNVTVTAGRLWSRVSDFSIASKNSATESMASLFFNGTNLTVTSGITQWDNQNFNNVSTGSLVTIGNNKWANLWFFMSFDGSHYGFAYGTADYNSLGQAANEAIPSYLTQNFFNQFVLLGRFVFQKSAATPGQIESAFGGLFSTQAVNTHNDLGGLQGGAVGEFYHLTAAQQADVATLSTGGTTGQFFRGDQQYSNTLAGPFNVSNGPIDQSGTNTSQTFNLRLNATIQSGNTVQQQVLVAQPNISPTGASLSNMFGLIFLPTVSNSASAIGNVECVHGQPEIGSGFTGTIGSVNVIRAANPSAIYTVTGDYRQFLADNPTNVVAANTRGFESRVNVGGGVRHNIYALGTAPNYFRGSLGVNTTNQFGSGDGVIGLGNAATVPTTNPVSGAVIYAEAGAAKCRGSGGTITTFGPADPHCPVCSSDFVHEWENPKYGYLAVCMNCHCDGINSHTRVKGEWSSHGN